MPAAVVASQEAVSAMNSGNLGVALERIEHAAMLDPESPRVLYVKGLVLTRLERLEEARLALETLVEKYPRYEDAYLKLGNVALRQQQFSEAAAHYQQSIQFEPTPSAWYNLALTHGELNDVEAARAALGEALALDPDYANAYAALADFAEKEGDFETALAHAQQAATRRPDDYRLQEKVGFMLLRVGRNEEALTLLRKAVDEQPWDYQARYNLGQALQGLGRTKEAEAELQRAESDREQQAMLRRLERAVRMDPANGRLHFALGTEYQRWGRLDDALRSYRIAKQLLPNNLLVDVNLATLYLHLDQLDEARQRFESVVRQDSTVAAAWLNLGFLDARTGDLASAQANWARAIALQPEYSAAVRAFHERQYAP